MLRNLTDIGPRAKPDGPYDPMGGYYSDNYGDVIVEAQAETEWFIAERIRQYLAGGEPPPQIEQGERE